MVFSIYIKQRILSFYADGLRAPSISKKLFEEGFIVSRRGVYKFLQKYRQTGDIGGRLGSGRPSKITEEVKSIVDSQMERDDETSAVQLHALLTARGYEISLATILRCRVSLGWTFRGSSYCQLIRNVNKVKRLEWAKEHLREDFEDVIYTDECSIQFETHRRYGCRRKDERPRPKPR